MARVLETLGELSKVAGLSLHGHVPEILKLIIEALSDASNSKKAVAITTLGKVGLSNLMSWHFNSAFRS